MAIDKNGFVPIEDLVEQAIAAFEPILTPANYQQGEVIHREGQNSNAIFIVTKGILRSYYHVDGRDITAYFAMDNHIIGAVDSLIKGEGSIYNIEALEDTHALKLHYGEMEYFLDQNPRFERIARRISQMLYFDLVERVEGMTFLSAKQKYDHLLKRHPTITQRVNLGHIASFLGITPETLSRIRGQK